MKLTSHSQKIKNVYIQTVLFLIFVAALFLPVFSHYEEQEVNVYEVSVNGVYVGTTDEPERMNGLLWQARAAITGEERAQSSTQRKSSSEPVLIDASLSMVGRGMDYGTVDPKSVILSNMKEVMQDYLRETWQKAYTVKINRYTVNLKNSIEVCRLLEASLRPYDQKRRFKVILDLDPERELNILKPIITENVGGTVEDEGNAGIDAFLNAAIALASPSEAKDSDFEDLDYGLISLAFGEKVEVVEAYLPADQITELSAAIAQVQEESDKEVVYEVQSGDTLSTIAQNFDLTMQDLIKINDSLENENSTVRIGDELLITVPRPTLSVLHTELVYEEGTYDAPVEYIDEDSWYTTKTEVIQDPSAGHRKSASIVTSRNDTEVARELVKEEVDYPAVPKRVRKGTKVPPTFVKPLSGGRVSSAFGKRKAPKKGASTYHKGIDYATPVGTAIMASSGGVVTRAGWGSGYGYVVYIQHPDGRETRYGHLSKVLVHVGQRVNQGQKIALSGNTGRSTGPHLHFEILVNGVAVNPNKYY